MRGKSKSSPEVARFQDRIGPTGPARDVKVLRIELAVTGARIDHVIECAATALPGGERENRPAAGDPRPGRFQCGGQPLIVALPFPAADLTDGSLGDSASSKGDTGEIATNSETRGSRDPERIKSRASPSRAMSAIFLHAIDSSLKTRRGLAEGIPTSRPAIRVPAGRRDGTSWPLRVGR